MRAAMHGATPMLGHLGRSGNNTFFGMAVHVHACPIAKVNEIPRCCLPPVELYLWYNLWGWLSTLIRFQQEDRGCCD